MDYITPKIGRDMWAYGLGYDDGVLWAENNEGNWESAAKEAVARAPKVYEDYEPGTADDESYEWGFCDGAVDTRYGVDAV